VESKIVWPIVGAFLLLVPYPARIEGRVSFVAPALLLATTTVGASVGAVFFAKRINKVRRHGKGTEKGARAGQIVCGTVAGVAGALLLWGLVQKLKADVKGGPDKPSAATSAVRSMVSRVPTRDPFGRKSVCYSQRNFNKGDVGHLPVTTAEQLDSSLRRGFVDFPVINGNIVFPEAVTQGRTVAAKWNLSGLLVSVDALSYTAVTPDGACCFRAVSGLFAGCSREADRAECYLGRRVKATKEWFRPEYEWTHLLHRPLVTALPHAEGSVYWAPSDEIALLATRPDGGVLCYLLESTSGLDEEQVPWLQQVSNELLADLSVTDVSFLAPAGCLLREAAVESVLRARVTKAPLRVNREGRILKDTEGPPPAPIVVLACRSDNYHFDRALPAENYEAFLFPVYDRARCWMTHGPEEIIAVQMTRGDPLMTDEEARKIRQRVAEQQNSQAAARGAAKK